MEEVISRSVRLLRINTENYFSSIFEMYFDFAVVVKCRRIKEETCVVLTSSFCRFADRCVSEIQSYQ